MNEERLKAKTSEYIDSMKNSKKADPEAEARKAARENLRRSLRGQAIDAVCCNEGLGDELFAREVLGEAKMAYILGEIPREVFYEFHDLLIVLFNSEKERPKKNCQKRIQELGW